MPYQNIQRLFADPEFRWKKYACWCGKGGLQLYVSLRCFHMKSKHYKLWQMYTHLKAVKNPEDVNLNPHVILPRPTGLGTLDE
jgi:hypothetical protein